MDDGAERGCGGAVGGGLCDDESEGGDCDERGDASADGRGGGVSCDVRQGEQPDRAEADEPVDGARLSGEEVRTARRARGAGLPAAGRVRDRAAGHDGIHPGRDRHGRAFDTRPANSTSLAEGAFAVSGKVRV